MRFTATERMGGSAVPVLIAIVAALSLLTQPAVVTAWPTWEDQTAIRISGDPLILNDDEQEKDIVAGDVDRDGDADVIVVRKVPFSVPGALNDILLMNEFGVLTDRTSELANDMNFPTDARDVQLGYLDDDEWLDIVVANTFDQVPVIHMNQGESTQWDGFLKDAARIPTFPMPPMFCAVGLGDVTGNGMPDMYFSDYENDLEDRLLINDGAGFFSDETTTRIASGLTENIFGTGAEVLDFNMDGWDDIMVNHALEDVHILLNDRTGNFPNEQILDSDEAYMFACGDLDGNLRPDVYIVQDQQDRVLLNMSTNPNGTVNFVTYDLTNSPRTESFGGNIDFRDIDLDGDIDVYVADVDVDIEGCDREATALENPGNGHVFDPIAGNDDRIIHEPTFDGRLTDIDGDGWVDIYAGWCGGTHVFRQVPGAPAGLVEANAAPATHGLQAAASPNPFRTDTVIEFSLADEFARDGGTHASLAIYDVQGRMVDELLNGQLGTGLQSVTWDGRDQRGRRVSPGVYFFRLDVAGNTVTQKLSVID